MTTHGKILDDISMVDTADARNAVATLVGLPELQLSAAMKAIRSLRKLDSGERERVLGAADQLYGGSDRSASEAPL